MAFTPLVSPSPLDSSKTTYSVKLSKIPYSSIATALSTLDPDSSTSRNQSYNTVSHTFDEISTSIPASLDLPEHCKPPNALYTYSRYLPVIARSQHISEYFKIPVPRTVVRDLEEAHAAHQSRRVVREDLVEDVVATWAAGSTGELLREAFSNGSEERRWFVRLDDCSPKDSPVVRGAVRSLEEMVRKIATSARAMGAIRRAVDEGRAERCILMPWREGMDLGREWRCFVPPLRLRGDRCNDRTRELRVGAVSQYQWHKPLKMSSDLQLEEMAEKVADGAQRVLQEILLHSREHESGLEEELQRYGLTFDVALMLLGEGGNTEVQLVEVNPFGAMSGCGACLYHWIQDARRLYGLEESVEVKVTLAEDDVKS